MRPFDVFSHFTLGNLSYENGMPAFGYPAMKFSLTSGQVVHTDAELLQVYSGRGGGFELVVLSRRADGH